VAQCAISNERSGIDACSSQALLNEGCLVVPGRIYPNRPRCIAVMSAPYRVTIEDLQRQINVAEGQLLLDALLAQGVRFAYSCQAGNCGACKCRLVAGEVDALEFSDQALSSAQSEQGIILACRSRARSDLTIRFVTPDS
jgi:ferredoxin